MPNVFREISLLCCRGNIIWCKTGISIALFISVTLEMLLTLDLNLGIHYLLNLNWRNVLRVKVQTMFGKLAKCISSSSFEGTLLIFTSINCLAFFTNAPWAGFKWLNINRGFSSQANYYLMTTKTLNNLQHFTTM